MPSSGRTLCRGLRGVRARRRPAGGWGRCPPASPVDRAPPARQPDGPPSPPLQVNAFTSFVFPMVVISVLNTVIANKLTVMVRQAAEQGQAGAAGGPHGAFSMSVEPGRVQTLRHGVRVLRT